MVLANKRHRNTGTETIMIHRNFVKQKVFETSCLTKPFTTSCGARFARTAAGTQTVIIQGNLQNTSCLGFFEFYVDPSKTRHFGDRKFEKHDKHNVSDLQMRPNLAHSDSKLCFSNLVHAPRPPAIEFLVLSGFWTPDPLQTIFQQYLWGARSSANTVTHGVRKQTSKNMKSSLTEGPKSP